MQFYKVPIYPNDSKEVVQAYHDFLGLPINIKFYEKPQLVNGLQRRDGPVVKPWVDSAGGYGAGPFQYIVRSSLIELKVRERVGDAGAVIRDVEGLRGLEHLYGGPAIEFYNRRVLAGDTRFNIIPGLKLVTYTRQEVLGINLGTDSFSQWPIAVPVDDEIEFSTINKYAAFMVQGVDTVAFDVREFDQAYPLTPATTPAPTLSNGFTAMETIEAIRGVLLDPRLRTSDARIIAIANLLK